MALLFHPASIVLKNPEVMIRQFHEQIQTSNLNFKTSIQQWKDLIIAIQHFSLDCYSAAGNFLPKK